MSRSLSRAGQTVKSFARGTVNVLKNVGFAALGLQASFGALEGLLFPVKLAAQAEQTATSFKVLLGSMEDANALIKELQSFTATTPLREQEVNQSAKALLAFGFSADEVIGELQMLGDLASGVGIPLNELAQIIGKLKVQNRFMGEDFAQLVGRGIPIGTALADVLDREKEDIRGMISAGEIQFDDVQKALEKLTQSGGQYFGMMTEQSKTLNGLFSTLQDNMTAALRDIGQELVASLDLKQITEDAIELIGEIRGPLLEAFKEVAKFAADMLGSLRETAELINGLTAADPAKNAKSENWLYGMVRDAAGGNLAEFIVEGAKRQSDPRNVRSLIRGASNANRGNVGVQQSVPTMSMDEVNAGLNRLSQPVTDYLNKFNDALTGDKSRLPAFPGRPGMISDSEYKRLQQLSSSIFDETRTPMENFKMRINDIITALNSEILDPSVAVRGIESARKQFESAMEAEKPEFRQIGSLERGSREVFDVLARAQAKSDSVEEKQLTEQKEMKKLLKEANAQLKKVAAPTSGNQVEVVISDL